MTPDCLIKTELDIVHTVKDFSVQSYAPYICPSLSYFGIALEKTFGPKRSFGLFEQVNR